MTPAHLRYSPETYARILIKQYGLAAADRIANTRESQARTDAGATFYSRVMVIIDRAMTGGIQALENRDLSK